LPEATFWYHWKKTYNKGYGLENAGVKLDQRGYVTVNNYLQTNIKIFMPAAMWPVHTSLPHADTSWYVIRNIVFH